MSEAYASYLAAWFGDSDHLWREGQVAGWPAVRHRSCPLRVVGQVLEPEGHYWRRDLFRTNKRYLSLLCIILQNVNRYLFLALFMHLTNQPTN